MEQNYKGCPANFKALDDAMYILGRKWTIKVLASILAGNNRFREIERSILKVSTKVLASELKFLEQNLLITRTVNNDIPVSVIYEPTEYAMSLEKVLEEMIVWGRLHNGKIREAE